MYDESGKITWQGELDIYGKLRNFEGSSPTACPFHYQGQYEDIETGLYYNRFRYYSPDEGMYISQDPIGLAGNNPTLYGYVKNINTRVDIFGLFDIALGIYPSNVDIGTQTGSLPDGKWFEAGITDVEMNSTTFPKYFDDVARQADAIHFDISMVNPADSKLAGLDFELNLDGSLKSGNVTNVELNRILTDQDLFNKTSFYGFNNKGEYVKFDNDLVKKFYGICK